ncbi:MAG: phage major capsid protein [Oscillospiraceae bacterium]|nr:phage major capsid protein [Oscillospiraceae bacterium]
MQLKAHVAEETRALAAELLAAMKCEDEAERAQMFVEAFSGFTEKVENTVGEKIETALSAIDNKIMSKRGERMMTSKEKEFAESLKASVMSGDPQMSITDLDKAFPETIITTVLEDVKTDHELLDVINFVNTSVVTKFIYSKDVKKMASWGPLKSGFYENLGAAIDTIDVTFCKLYGMLTVPKDMIDVSPSWLLTLVMMILSEAISNGLENGIINGDGNNMPIGMRKDLNGNVVGGVYSDKTAVKLNTLAPVEYCGVVAKLTRTEDNEPRKVAQVILICNPTDYLTKILPASTLLTPGGDYRNNIFPFPTRVIQSEHLKDGEAVLGIADKYFMGVGMPKSGRIEYSDHVKFIEDVRVYACKLHGNGRPKDNNAFVLLDISELQPLVFNVGLNPSITGSSASVTLFKGITELTIGTLDLSPIFSPGVYTYTADTTNATNSVKVTADAGVDVIIKLNGTEMSNNTGALWQPGANLLEITATDGFASKTYTVTVNKT